MRALTVFIVTVLAVSSAHARWKDTSGGNGVGGTLLDIHEAGEAVEINGEELIQILNSRYSDRLNQLPFLKDYAVSQLAGFRTMKSWYLDGRHFAKECENQSVLDLPDRSTIACQNDVEVRVQVDWWKAASKSDQAALILHEVFTAISLNTQQFRALREAVALMSATSFSAAAFQSTIEAHGFPYIPTTTELDKARARLDFVKAQLITTVSDRDRLTYLADETLARMNEGSMSPGVLKIYSDALLELDRQATAYSRRYLRVLDARQVLYDVWLVRNSLIDQVPLKK